MNYCPRDIHIVRAATIKFDVIMSELIPPRVRPWPKVEKLQETIQPYWIGSIRCRDTYRYDCYGEQKILLQEAYNYAGMFAVNAIGLGGLVDQRKMLIAKLRSLRP